MTVESHVKDPLAPDQHVLNCMNLSMTQSKRVGAPVTGHKKNGAG